MISPVLDLFTLFFHLSIWLLCLIGWGALVKKLIGIDSEPKISDAWFGLAAGIAYVEACNLWLPIDWKVSLLFLLIGAIGAITITRNNSHYLRLSLRKLLNTNPLILLIGFLILLMSGFLAMTTPASYDAGLYFFQSIRWINEYPTTLGLANLHGRLGFNQSYFSFVALLNLFPLFNKGYAVCGMLILLIASASLFEARLISLKGGWWVIIWILIAFIGVSKHISSPSPDAPVILIQSSIFVFLLRLYTDESKDKREQCYNVMTIFVLSCIVVTVKLSSAVYALMSLALVLPFIFKTIYLDKKIYLATFAFGVLLVGMHLIRGVLYSGVPLYPSTVGAMWNLDWTVSYQQAKSEADWIYSWARAPFKNPSEVLDSWGWFAEWGSRFLKDYKRYLYGFLILTGLNFIVLIFKSRQIKDKGLFFLYLPLVAGILFWFMTAPDWRFLGAIPQLSIALSGFICIRCLLPTEFGRFTQKLPTYFPPSFFGLVILVLMVKSTDLKNLPLSGWHSIPSIETKEQLTESGLKIFVPIAGDQCWDSSLPCTPYFNDALKLRKTDLGAQNLEAGFSIKK